MLLAATHRATRAAHRLKGFVKSREYLFGALGALSASSRKRMVTRDTGILIDGYPRSGNSFAVTAFLDAQNSATSIAHHHHCAGQFLLAARLGVPALLTVRDPVDAVASVLVFFPWMTPRTALRDYIRLHDRVARIASRVVIADFQEVTTDFGLCIRRVNAAFGTKFAPFIHDEHSVARVRMRLDAENRSHNEPEYRRNQSSAFKDRRKQEVRLHLESPELRPLMNAAGRLYLDLRALSTRTPHAPTTSPPRHQSEEDS